MMAFSQSPKSLSEKVVSLARRMEQWPAIEFDVREPASLDSILAKGSLSVSNVKLKFCAVNSVAPTAVFFLWG